MRFIDVIAEQFAEDLPPIWREGPQETYLSVGDAELGQMIALMEENEAILLALFAAEDFAVKGLYTLFYVFEKRRCPDLVVVLHTLAGKETASIAEVFPIACWYEREVRDGFGIEFAGAFDKRRLFLHEAYPENFHPLLKSFRNQPLETRTVISPEAEYPFKKIEGEGVYQIPVGPVHAGIIEPGHFRFSVIGETIFNLETRMFYKHRGIEKLAEGKKPADCLTIAETISGDESVANAVGFCSAVERIAEAELPRRAWHLRTLFLEMERIYSHLGDMAGMILDVAYPVGASRFFQLREEMLRWNQRLSGSRFLKGSVCLGGARKDVPGSVLRQLDDDLLRFLPEFRKAWEAIHASSSVMDRLETTGIIEESLVSPLNVTGPAARACGVPIDTRRDHSYGIYSRLSFTVQTGASGDVLDRFNVKAREIEDSVGMIREVMGMMKPGQVCWPIQLSDGSAFSLVEAARGQCLHWVNLREGVVDRYKVRTASFCNWQALEHAVLGNIVPDFPLINKSLNLSYAGTDL